MGRKKKIGTAGRFGSRYGKKDRQAVADIEKIQRLRHNCPRCGLPYVKRLASGIWKCRKCGNTFTGPSYYPTSASVSKRSG